jgi:hypothetical protein
MRKFVILLIAFAGAGMICAAGCSSDAPSNNGDPTTQAMSDPMNYSPGHEDEDISGGGMTDFHGDAFKKDMDHVLNP